VRGDRLSARIRFEIFFSVDATGVRGVSSEENVVEDFPEPVLAFDESFGDFAIWFVIDRRRRLEASDFFVCCIWPVGVSDKSGRSSSPFSSSSVADDDVRDWKNIEETSDTLAVAVSSKEETNGAKRCFVLPVGLTFWRGNCPADLGYCRRRCCEEGSFGMEHLLSLLLLFVDELSEWTLSSMAPNGGALNVFNSFRFPDLLVLAGLEAARGVFSPPLRFGFLFVGDNTEGESSETT